MNVLPYDTRGSLTKRPFDERFIPEPNSGCWLWLDSLDRKGYGQITLGGKRAGNNYRAHRISYELHVGPVPDGLDLDHKCRVRSCVNPQHLEPVTRRINGLRGIGISAVRARQTHCIHGHELNPENTRIRRDGTRDCRTCYKARAKLRHLLHGKKRAPPRRDTPPPSRVGDMVIEPDPRMALPREIADIPRPADFRRLRVIEGGAA